MTGSRRNLDLLKLLSETNDSKVQAQPIKLLEPIIKRQQPADRTAKRNRGDRVEL
jgi:hypothetical protein